MQKTSELFKKNIKDTEREIKGYVEVLYDNDTSIKANMQPSRNTAIGTVNNYPIEITDALNEEAIENIVYGNSYQETRSGINLYNPIITSSGTNISRNKVSSMSVANDGTITMVASGTDMFFSNVASSDATYNEAYYGYLMAVKPNTTYRLHCTNNQFNKTYISEYNSSKVSTGYTGLATYSKDFTTKSDTAYVTIRFGVRDSVSGTTYSTKVMVSEGSGIKEYEPYGATPSPDIPSTIQNVGVCNLYSAEQDFNISQTDSYHIAYLNPNTTYTISFTKSRISGVTIGNNTIYKFATIRCFKSDGSVISNISSSTTSLPSGSVNITQTFTTPANLGYVGINFGNNNGDTNVNTLVSNIRIEKGSVSHDYVPYGNWIVEKDYIKYTGDNLTSTITSTIGNAYFYPASVTMMDINDLNGQIGLISQNMIMGFPIAITGGKKYKIINKSGTPIKVASVPLEASVKRLPIQTSGTYFGEFEEEEFEVQTKDGENYIVISTNQQSINHLYVQQNYEIRETGIVESEPNKVIVSLNKENLFDKDNLELGLYNLGNDGSKVDKTTRARCKSLIKVLPNTQYTISTNSNFSNVGIGYYKSDYTYIKGENNGTWLSIPYTFKTTSDTTYIAIMFKDNDKTIDISKNYDIVLYQSSEPFPYYELNKIGDIQDEVDIKKGILTKRITKISSYNGETITTPYMSTTGQLTTGATVYYVLEEPETIKLSYLLENQDYSYKYIDLDYNVLPPLEYGIVSTVTTTLLTTDAGYTITYTNSGTNHQNKQVYLSKNDTNIATLYDNTLVPAKYINRYKLPNDFGIITSIGSYMPKTFIKPVIMVSYLYNKFIIDGEINPSNMYLKYNVYDKADYEDPSKSLDNSRVATKYGILNENFILDGSVTLASTNKPSNNNMPWIIPYVYDFETKKFKYNNHNLDYITIKYTPKDNHTYHCNGITIYFDGGYPFNFDINGIEVRNNEKEAYVCLETFGNSDIEIKIYDWSNDNQKIRISEIDFGITNVYRNNELIEFDIDEQLSILNTEIPINECNFTIPYNDNFDVLNNKGITKFLKNSVEIRPYIGTYGNDGDEYISCGVYYLDTWNNQNNEKIVVNAKSILNKFLKENLRSVLFGSSPYNNYFSSVTNSKTLIDTWLSKTYSNYKFVTNMDTRKLNIDNPSSTKSSDTVKTYFSILALRTYSTFYEKRDNSLYLGVLDDDYKDILTNNELLDKPRIEIANKISYFKDKITYDDMLRDELESYEKTYSFYLENDISYFNLEHEPFLKNDTISITTTDANATITIQDSSQFFTTIKVASSNDEKRAINIKLTCNKYKHNVEEYYYTYKNVYITQSELENGEQMQVDEEVAPTTGVVSYGLAYAAENVFLNSPKYKVNLEYNGDPSLEIGDLIKLETENEIKEMRITRSRLKYDGGLSGEIEGEISV